MSQFEAPTSKLPNEFMPDPATVPHSFDFHAVMTAQASVTKVALGPQGKLDVADGSLPPGLIAGPQPDTFDPYKVKELTCPENPTLSPERFLPSVNKYIEQDREKSIGHVETVFFGSSTIAYWKEDPKANQKEDLETTFKNIGALNRGVGGTTLSDLDKFAEDLVLKHTPERVILYAGTNDIAEGHDSDKVFEDFRKLEQRIHGTSTTEPKLPGASPDIKLYIIGMIPAPCREVLEDKFHLYDDGNAKIKQYTRNIPNTFYIDPTPSVADRTGHLDPGRFMEDHLHPKQDVYRILAGIIKRDIAADEVGTP